MGWGMDGNFYLLARKKSKNTSSTYFYQIQRLQTSYFFIIPNEVDKKILVKKFILLIKVMIYTIFQ